MRRHRLALAAVAAGVALAAPATALPANWLEAVQLSQPGTPAQLHDLAGNARGDVVAVWLETDPGWSSCRIRAAFRPAGAAAFAEPATIADACSGPVVAIDGSGTATVAWGRFSAPGDATIEVARGTAAGWSAPEQLTEPGTFSMRPAIAASARGEVVVGWWARTGSPDDHRGVVRARLLRVGAVAWTPTASLVPEGAAPADDVRVAIDDGGTAHALFVRYGATAVTQVASTLADGTWGEPATLDDRPALHAFTGGAIVAGESGRAIAAIVSFGVGGAGGSTIEAFVRQPDGTWSGPTALADGGVQASLPRIALGPAGRATVAWTNGWTVQASDLDPTAGTWSRRVDLAAGGAPDVAIDAEGGTLVVWDGPLGWSYRPPGGSFAPAGALPGPSNGLAALRVASTGAGQAVALWANVAQAGPAGPFTTFAATFDARLPSPTPPPPPPPEPVEPAEPVLVIGPDASRVSASGVVSLRVGCRTAEPGRCAGTLALRVPGRAAGASARRERTIGKARFAIGPGVASTTIVRIRLPAVERAVLRARGTVWARAVARAGRSATVERVVALRRPRR